MVTPHDLPEGILEHLCVLSRAMPEETDWLVVKRKLIPCLAPRDRGLFTRRDEKTKRHHPFNRLELAVRERWQELTGNVLHMPPDKRLFDTEEGYI